MNVVKLPPFAARAILFDWDGTLINSYEADRRAYEEMFRLLGIRWSPSKLAKNYSPDWYRVYRAMGVPRAEWKRADRLWRRAYARQVSLLMPGARRTLARLRGRFVLGVVTGGHRRRVWKQLRGMKLAPLFSVCICSDDVPRRKPHPAPLRAALRRLHLEPAECVYVGDTPEDIEMARRAKVRMIAVPGPFPSANKLRAARPDLLIDSITRLPGILRRLTR